MLQMLHMWEGIADAREPLNQATLYKVGSMKNRELNRRAIGTDNRIKAAMRSPVEALEPRRLMSAVYLANVPEGVKLADGGWLFVNSDGKVSETQADGSLDLSFGQNGVAGVSGVTFGGEAMNQSVSPFAVTDSGDILVAGSESGGAVVAKFHADGTIDSAFGDRGVASVQLGSGSPGFFALAIQDDGKIVAVGESYVQNIDQPIWQFCAARFNGDGSIDKTFNNSGVISVALPGTKGFATGDIADAVTIAKDGKILVGGTSASTTGPTNPALGFGLIRLNADGTLDTTFGDGGKVVTYFQNAEPDAISMDRAQMDSLFVRDDGTILAVGSGQNLQILASAYNPDGSLDANWGIGGRLLVYANSGDPEHAQLTNDGGFKVFDHNGDTLFLTIGPDGKSPNPNPVDPTPTQAPIVNTPITSDPHSVAIGIDPIPGIGQETVVPPHAALHSRRLHHLGAGQSFSGTLAVAERFDPTQTLHPTASIDWGDGSAAESVTLTPDAKHPAFAAVIGTHTYQAGGVYTVTVQLVYGSVTEKTVTEKIHVRDRSDNGRLIHAVTGQPFSKTLGVVAADLLGRYESLYHCGDD